MAPATEFDLSHAEIGGIRSGDRAAFRNFVKRNRRWVRGVVFGVLGDTDKLDDAMQQVWSAVWLRSNDLRNTDQWRTWLYRLARNAAVDQGREQTRRQKLIAGSNGRSAGSMPGPPDENLVQSERHRSVLSAIAGLPASYREPFVLRHLEGWNYRRIAEVMQIPPATVETRLARARRMLRESLAGKV